MRAAATTVPAAPEQMRRGACPALSAPMQTGDGLLVRLNLAEGGMTPAQLQALCDLAARHGNGIVEVTARGSFQIRGLTAASAPLLEADVAALALSLREGVPVETSPLAGLDPDELADPRPLVRAIRAGTETAGLADRLGPKVSVVVDGGGSVDLSGILADVRLTARRGEDGIDWRVAIGGTAATARPVAMLDAAGAIAAALAVLEAVAALGTSGRARDLTLPPPPEPVLGPAFGQTRGAVPLPRFAGEEPGPRTAATPVVPPFMGEGNHAQRGEEGVVPLPDARLALAAALPFGSMEAGALAAFAQAAARHGVADIRLAPGRSLILLCPTPDAARGVAGEARRHGLILDADDPRRNIAACPGAPACASGRIATREIARRLAAGGRLAGSVHVSGCEKGCAHPAPADFVVAGTGAGIALIRRGRAADTPFATVADIDAALAALH